MASFITGGVAPVIPLQRTQHLSGTFDFGGPISTLPPQPVSMQALTGGVDQAQQVAGQGEGPIARREVAANNGQGTQTMTTQGNVSAPPGDKAPPGSAATTALGQPKFVNASGGGISTVKDATGKDIQIFQNAANPAPNPNGVVPGAVLRSRAAGNTSPEAQLPAAQFGAPGQEFRGVGNNAQPIAFNDHANAPIVGVPQLKGGADPSAGGFTATQALKDAYISEHGTPAAKSAIGKPTPVVTDGSQPFYTDNSGNMQQGNDPRG